MVNDRRRKFSFIATLVVALVLALTCLGLTGAQSPSSQLKGGWQPGPERYHPTRLLVRFSDIIGAEDATNTIESLGYSLYKTADFSGNSALVGFRDCARIGIVEIPENERMENAISALSALPGIMYVERDPVHYPASVGASAASVAPDDIWFEALWGMNNHDLFPSYRDPGMTGDPVDNADIDMPEAWARFTGSEEVIVAVIDTGCYYYHPDLVQNIWVNEAELYGEAGVDDDGNGYIDDIYGWDFYHYDNTVFDWGEYRKTGGLNDAHGTHCAGTIGGVGNNSIGVAGVNWNVKIMPLKFLGPDGGYTSDAILAIEYAMNNGAKVMSNSWGGGGYSQALKEAIEASGILFIAAAGNSGRDNDVIPHYPSSYDCPNIITVAASMQNDKPCDYAGWWGTNYGATSVHVFAPGGYILSTVPPDPAPSPTDPPKEAYEFYYGTSMATPHVSGIAALLVGKYPDMPQYPGAHGWSEGDMTVREAIINTVERKPAFEGKCTTGGRVNALYALALSRPPEVVSATATPTKGAPPLTVEFSAVGSDPEGRIADMWWDFGDGSDPVHECETSHTYTELGQYDASFHVVDDAGLEAVAVIPVDVFLPPQIGIAPVDIEADLNWDETDTKTFTITNSGIGELRYSIDLQLGGHRPAMADGVGALGMGGSDEYGYVWLDSNHEGGPVFEWCDISAIGTKVELGDDDQTTVDLPFEFEFYGQPKNAVTISSNGYLTFGASGTKYSNTYIPNRAEPNDLIAVFWDDLRPDRGGNIYVYGDRDRFIVQYQDVPRGSSGPYYTFQVIVAAEGHILYQYLSMPGTRLDEATIGIEDVSGLDGLQVAFNEEYVTDNLAILFVPKWVEIEPIQGVIQPGESQDIEVLFSANRLPKGRWDATAVVRSNDLENPELPVGMNLNVNSILAPVIQSIAARPWVGMPPLEVKFSATAVDRDGEIVDIVWDFGDGSELVRGDLSPKHIYAAEGNYKAKLAVTDDDGLSSTATVDIVAGPAARVSVNPGSITVPMRAHRTHAETLSITNVGEEPLSFLLKTMSQIEPAGIVPAGAGGPDQYGYVWFDSDHVHGPEFEWVDIVEEGNRIPQLKNNEYITVELPFEFPFYGVRKTEVKINSNGHLTFGRTGSADWRQSPIPSPASPSDLLAVWWCNLRPSPQGGVYHYYDEANDRYIVTYDNVPKSPDIGSLTFQVILHPDGTIIYQYLDMQFPSASDEADATVGIENAAGVDGLQVLHNTAGYVHNGLAIVFSPYQWLSADVDEGTLQPGEAALVNLLLDVTPIESGRLEGAVVIESNDIVTPKLRVPVSVEIIPNSAPVITACGVNPPRGPLGTVFQLAGGASDDDGTIVDKYWDFGDGSPRVRDFVTEHVYEAEGKYIATFHAIDNDGYEAVAEVTVRVQHEPSAHWNPAQIGIRAPQGQTATGSITLSNTGLGNLVFGNNLDVDSANKPLEANSAAPLRSEWLPENVGAIIDSWTSPAPVSDSWAVCINPATDDLIIVDSTSKLNHLVTREGEYTGVSWDTSWARNWAAGMTSDGAYVWQVNVGDDNGIYRLDPLTGEAVASISAMPWARSSQLGLAYNPDDDTFFIGGINNKTIYRIKGLSWGNPGELIDQVTTDLRISGLAYHPVAKVLVVATTTWPDVIYYIDYDNRNIVARFPHPAGKSFGGGGIDFDSEGNLWVTSMNENSVYVIDSGLGPISPWLSWQPTSGVVEPGGQASIIVEVDASHLEVGTHRGNAVLFTNDLDNPMIIVPVHAVVAEAPQIVEATVDRKLGAPPLTVQFSATVKERGASIVGHVWDFGDGESSTELNSTHVYSEEGIYRAVFTVTDEFDGVAKADFMINVRRLPVATVDQTVIEVTMPIRDSISRTITIGNVDGEEELDFKVIAKDGAAPQVALPQISGEPLDASGFTSAGLFAPIDPEVVEQLARSAEESEIGDVLLVWDIPAPINYGWGCGFDGTYLWISDALSRLDHLVYPHGEPTWINFNLPWVGDWGADMAFDSNHNLMWQVNRAGDNGIHGLDPNTGQEMEVILGRPWTDIDQRGLAYNPENDTFYVGGWIDNIVYHIKGLSWDNPGEVLDWWPFPVGISGMAWHPDGVLWIASNAQPDMVYAVDPVTHAVLHEFPNPSKRSYSGAGAAMNKDGNLWIVSQQEQRVYLINTGMPVVHGVEVEPAHGEVAPGAVSEVQVTLNAEKLGQPGECVHRRLEVLTNDPFRATLNIDVIVHIEAGPSISDFAVAPTVGEPPLTVEFSATVNEGDAPIVRTWWEFGDGADAVEGVAATHVYTKEGIYEASLHVLDENGAETVKTVEIRVGRLPVLEIEPESFDKVVPVGGEIQDVMILRNTGNAPLSYEARVEKAGDEDLADLSKVVRVNPVAGAIQPGLEQNLLVTFGSADAEPGWYKLAIYVSTNDPLRADAVVPVNVKVNQAPTVSIILPAGGETCHGEQEIRWTATDPDDLPDTLSIDLLWTRDGQEWHEIATAVPNTGSYMWKTSSVRSSGDGFRVRVAAHDPWGASAVATSRQFAIANVAPEVKILKPEAGALWTGVRTIEYEAIDEDGDELAISLEYERVGEADWKLIGDGQPNTGTFAWDTTKLEAGGVYRVRVAAADQAGGVGEAVSDDFTIVVVSGTVVAAPNPAEQSVTFYYAVQTGGKLCVYDVAGRLVHSAELAVGSSACYWDLTANGSPVASGLYLYVVVTDVGEISEVGRLVIQR